jgi:hypothetical protein
MTADLFHLGTRRKPVPFLPTGMEDFDLAPAGRTSVETLAASPDWTLYTVDLARGQAMLVEMPAGTNLADAPFYYLDQYDRGLRAAVIGLDSLIAASGAIRPPASLSFLFSTGRCGSTLASRILAQVPGVWSLSEPDSLTAIALAHRHFPRADMVALVRATTLWTCRPPFPTETVIIKPRSEATLIAELCQAAFPQSHNLFMYRDLPGWIESISRFEQRIEGPEIVLSETEYWRDMWDFLMVGTPVSFLESCFSPDHGPILGSEFHTLLWDLRIEGYLRALRRGMKFTAIHYADLNGNRTVETARLLAGCGISPRFLDLAMQGFIGDSHKGSGSSNATATLPLPEARKARAAALLARLGKRDYVRDRLPDSAHE